MPPFEALVQALPALVVGVLVAFALGYIVAMRVERRRFTDLVEELGPLIPRIVEDYRAEVRRDREREMQRKADQARRAS